MQFTTTYRQTTKTRRRCMICNKLVKDGELVFFKGERGRAGKAVHDDCRSDTGGDWYARDCAVTYQQQRLGGWELVTDYDLKAKHEQRAKEEMHALEYNEMKEYVAEGRMTEEFFLAATRRFRKSEHGYTIDG
tara:strand:- start:33 stop:431 length:399 start_codon:yes stop_codon:yes gene_type:complete